MDMFKRILSVMLIAAVMITGVMAVTAQPVSAASSQDSVTKSVTKVSSKTSNKSVKMKSKAKKSKVTTKITTTKSSKVLSKTAAKKVVQQKTTRKTVKTTYKKKSKIKKIKTTTKTTLTTKTTTYKKKTVSAPAVKTETADSIINVVPVGVMDAFEQLGFKVVINSSLSTAGNFSTSRHDISLKKADSGHLLHEMGHFLSCLKNNAAKTDEFIAIYNEEKSKYTGSNKTYITATNDEYFAESYRDYVTEPAKLRAERPQTYAYINELATSITQEDIDRTRQQYSWAW